MNTIISTKSWHYWIAKTCGSFDHLNRREREELDVCRYSRMVVKGLLWFLIVGAVGAVVAASFGDGIAWLASGLINGFVRPGEMMLPAFIVIVMTIFLICLWGFVEANAALRMWRMAKRHDQAMKQKQPGFIATAYKQYKNKYCTRVVLSDE